MADLLIKTVYGARARFKVSIIATTNFRYHLPLPPRSILLLLPLVLCQVPAAVVQGRR
jgi:hypothetical protein